MSTVLPTGHQERKDTPIMRGVLDYFPAAIAEVARISKKGNDQHNPGQPIHWARGKSTDHADCAVRHLMDRGKIDSDGERHTAKAAWRVLAELQEELEREGATPGRASVFPVASVLIHRGELPEPPRGFANPMYYTGRDTEDEDPSQ